MLCRDLCRGKPFLFSFLAFAALALFSYDYNNIKDLVAGVAGVEPTTPGFGDVYFRHYPFDIIVFNFQCAVFCAVSFMEASASSVVMKDR